MRWGLPLSILFHGLLLAVVMVGWPSFSKPVSEKSVDVPVEIVTEDQVQPPQGRKQDHAEDRKPDDDVSKRKITRPDSPPEPREAEMKKPTDAPDKPPVTPKSEPKAEAPKTPATPPDAAKPDMKKPSDTPDTATPKSERDTATPARPAAPPVPPRPEMRKPPETPASSTPKAERDQATPGRPAAPPAPRDVPIPQPKSAEKAPAVPDAERKATDVKKPPAPPEPERDQASLRPPPRVTAPDSSKVPERPDADRDGSPPERPASPPKALEKPGAVPRPPGAPERRTEEPQPEKPRITSRPEAPPQRAESEKKEGENSPRITSRPSEPPAPRASPRVQPGQPSAKPDTVQPNPDRARTPRQTADADRTARDPRQGVPNSPVLTRGQREAVVRKIRECWNVDRAAKDLSSLVVVIEVTMNEDGTVRDAVVSNETKGLGNATVRAFAESARRALLNPKCQPLPFPRGRYEEWRRFKAEFDPSDS